MSRASTDPGTSRKVLNLPNILTMARFLLIPVFAVTVIRNRPFAALCVVCLAGATDVLDGWAARRLRLQTDFGVLIDPLADKALGATAFVLLSLRGFGGAHVIPLWLTATVLGRDLVIVLGAMWAGSWLSGLFTRLGITLPAYVGAMFVAAFIRNLDDWTGLLKLSQRTIDDIGHISLSLFLVIALMTLRLWELAGLILPLVIILVGQLVLVTAFSAGPVFRLMGRSYRSAVLSVGFFGFMMGTIANAMASMKTIAEKYGSSKHAFLIASMVGAFFIDFTNALIITVFLNVFR